MKSVLIGLVALLALQACMEPRYVARPSPVSLHTEQADGTESIDATTGSNDIGDGGEVNYHLSPQWDALAPRCIAVLPLTATDISDKHLEQVRSALVAQLAPRGYRQIAPAKVDWAMAQGDATSLAQLGERLNCDAFLRGQVTEFSEQYFGLYSRISAGARLEIVDAADTGPLWSASHTATLENGGLPLTPVGLATSLVSAAVNLREEQSYRVADDLGRHLLKALPLAQQDFSEPVELIEPSESVAGSDLAIDTLQQVSSAIQDSDDPEAQPLTPGDFSALDGLETAQKIHQLGQWLEGNELTPELREASYTRLIELSPEAANYADWSLFRQTQGDYEAAAEYADKSIGLAPNDPSYHALRARLATVMGEPELALKQYLDAIVLAPEQATYYAELAHGYDQIGEQNRARAAYGMALERDPGLGFAWYNLAVMDFNAGDLAASARKFHLAASAYIEQGFPDTARAILDDLAQTQTHYADQAIRQLSLDLSHIPATREITK